MSASQFEQFGRAIVAWIKGEANASPYAWDWEYVDAVMELAVDAGLAKIVTYDPDKHGDLDVEAFDLEPGDDMYLWNDLPNPEQPEQGKQIIIGIKGGLVQWVKPDGIPSFVHDYDIDGIGEDEEFFTDENGNEYYEYEV